MVLYVMMVTFLFSLMIVVLFRGMWKDFFGILFRVAR